MDSISIYLNEGSKHWFFLEGKLLVNMKSDQEMLGSTSGKKSPNLNLVWDLCCTVLQDHIYQLQSCSFLLQQTSFLRIFVAFSYFLGQKSIH